MLTCDEFVFLLFQCAMLLHDKLGRSHELFKLFSQYPEELLLAVFACMLTDGLITKLKVSCLSGSKIILKPLKMRGKCTSLSLYT